MGERVLEVTEESWEREVLGAGQPVLVDFWAPWCAPCRAIAPIVAELAQQYAGRAKVVKVNVDEEGAVAARYDIRSIPSLIVFRDGKIADRRVGAAPRAQLAAFLESQLTATVSPSPS